VLRNRRNAAIAPSRNGTRRTDEIRQALSAWSALACSRLCFADPLPEPRAAFGQTDPSTLLSVLDGAFLFTSNVSTAELPPTPGLSAYETSTVNLDTGQVLYAVVYVAPAASPTTYRLPLPLLRTASSTAPDPFAREERGPKRERDANVTVAASAVCPRTQQWSRWLGCS
jgi:hypothetical protein